MVRFALASAGSGAAWKKHGQGTSVIRRGEAPISTPLTWAARRLKRWPPTRCRAQRPQPTPRPTPYAARNHVLASSWPACRPRPRRLQPRRRARLLTWLRTARNRCGWAASASFQEWVDFEGQATLRRRHRGDVSAMRRHDGFGFDLGSGSGQPQTAVLTGAVLNWPTRTEPGFKQMWRV